MSEEDQRPRVCREIDEGGTIEAIALLLLVISITIFSLIMFLQILL